MFAGVLEFTINTTLVRRNKLVTTLVDEFNSSIIELLYSCKQTLWVLKTEYLTAITQCIY